MPNPSVTAPSPRPRLLVSYRDAMAALAFGRRRLVALTTSGAIPSYKIGRSRRYCPLELAAWIRAGCPIEPGAGLRVREGMGK